MNLRNSFLEKGYCIAKNFIDADKIENLRIKCDKLLDNEQDATLKSTTFLKDQELSYLLFCDQSKEILNSLSSGYKYFLPNFTIRRNLYVDWHSDDAFISPDTNDLPGVLQCNIYLQDNCANYGGGIDIAIGTQTLNSVIKKEKISEDIEDKNRLSYETSKTKAGDFLIFDYRVIHRSTIPKISPRAGSRLAIQWTVCNSLERAQEFVAYLVRRQKERLHLSDFTDKRAIAYFFDAINVSFPSSFLKESRDLLQKNGLLVPSVESLGVL